MWFVVVVVVVVGGVRCRRHIHLDDKNRRRDLNNGDDYGQGDVVDDYNSGGDGDDNGDGCVN